MDYTEEIRKISKEEPTLRLVLRLKDSVETYDPQCIGIVEELERRVREVQ